MGQPMTPAWCVNLASDTWLMGRGGNGEWCRLEVFGLVLDLVGISWRGRILSCSHIGILGLRARGPQGWHLLQCLGMGAEIQHCCHPCWGTELQHPPPRKKTILGYTGYSGGLPQCPQGCRRLWTGQHQGQNIYLDQSPAQILLLTLSPSGRADYGHTGPGNPTSPATKRKS